MAATPTTSPTCSPICTSRPVKLQPGGVDPL
jgi:hypothetical protein